MLGREKAVDRQEAEPLTDVGVSRPLAGLRDRQSQSVSRSTAVSEHRRVDFLQRLLGRQEFTCQESLIPAGRIGGGAVVIAALLSID